jgi:hypothetical protein
MRWKAKNPSGTHAYYVEPYTVQHFADWLRQFVGDVGHFVLLLVSKRRRMDMARAYNQAIFGGISTEQIMVFDEDGARPLRPEERTWPE